VTALTVGAKALAKYPQHTEILYNFALALAFGGRLEDARRYAERVVEADADHEAAKKFHPRLACDRLAAAGPNQA
jgi:tetratricopeptide (TPR) repeat protein